MACEVRLIEVRGRSLRDSRLALLRQLEGSMGSSRWVKAWSTGGSVTMLDGVQLYVD